MVPSLGPLLDPDEYFDRNTPGLSLARAGTVALLITVLVTASFGAFGYALAERADAAGATVTVDNEHRPPDWVCKDQEAHDSPTEGCDEPKTREVPASTLIWDAVTDQLPVVFFGALVSWLLNGAAVHLLTAVTDGEGSFADSLAVAGWAEAGKLPMVIATTAVLLSLVGTFDFTAGEAALEQQVTTFKSGLNHPAIYLGTVLATGWQGYIYYHGMRHARDISRDAALVITGVGALVYFLGAVT